MTRHKSFSTGGRRNEPITFDIDNEQFTCHDELAGTALLEYTSMLLVKGDNAVGIQADAILKFFKDAMPAEEHERFRAFVDDPIRHVDIQLLGNIMVYLTEEFDRGSRPTQSSSGSATGRSSISATSKDDFSSPVSAVS